MERVPSGLSSESLLVTKYEGLACVTPPGSVYTDIQVSFSEKPLPLRKAFPAQDETREIIERMRAFRAEFPNTFNGILLGNPEFKLESSALAISAEQLYYQAYFAAHTAAREQDIQPGERYVALSVCGTVFNQKTGEFLLSTRPIDSQEDPGKIDAPGGVLTPALHHADPKATFRDRVARKLHLPLTETQVVCVGVERVFDDKYSLYNVVMLAVVDTVDGTSASHGALIPIADVVSYLESDKVTAPTRGALLLALASPACAAFGWSPERVRKEFSKPS